MVVAIGFALSAAALYFFLRRVELGPLMSAFASANLSILSLCVVTKGIVLCLNALRTRILLLPLRRYTLAECFVAWLSGYVADNLLPFRLGELVRIDLLARTGRISRGSTIAVVGLDRLIDLLSLLILLAAAAPLAVIDLGDADRLVTALAASASVVVIALWLATHSQALAPLVSALVRPLNETVQEWLIDKAGRFSEGLGALRSKTMIASVLGVTLAARLTGMLTIQLWLWAFDVSLPFYAPLVVLLFVSLGTMIPSSPGFIGTFHVACAYGLELMGVVPEIAASIAIAGHFMATVPWTVGGLGVSFREIRRIWRQPVDGAIEPIREPAHRGATTP